MRDHKMPPLEFDSDPDEEELMNIRTPFDTGRIPEWRVLDRRNIIEFGEVPGKEQGVMDQRVLVRQLIGECIERIALLENRITRYKYRLEFLKDVHPDYARDRAKRKMEDLTDPENHVRPDDDEEGSEGEA